MKTRCVFTTTNLAAARAAMAAARLAGIADNDIALVARADIEQAQIPDHLLPRRNDFIPAALRGILWGGGGGLLLGLIAEWLESSFEWPLSGALATCLIGAIAGCCMSAVMGAAVPDPINRKFKSEVDCGHILVVIDAPTDQLPRVEPAVANTGAILLPFHTHTVLT